MKHIRLLLSCTYILTTSAPTIIYITGISKYYAAFIEAKHCVKMHQTVRRQFTKLYGGNVPNCTAAIGVELRQLPVAPCDDGGTNTKPYGGNVSNLTAAMYQTIRRQCTKLYCGNVPNCTAAIGVGGRGGTLTKYPGKSRNPKSPHR